MNIKWMLLGLSMVVPCTVFALGQDACPQTSSIVMVDGFFEAPSRDSYVGWRAPAEDQFVMLRTFVGALFRPYEGTDRKGYLEGCSYKTYDGALVTLRYQPNIKRVLKVRLADSISWQLVKGSFGVDVYECSDTRINACGFSVLER